nr:glycosyltransferase [Pelagicoccus albus]
MPVEKPRLELLPGIDFKSLDNHKGNFLDPKSRYNLKENEDYILYSGGISSSNLGDVAALYDAVHIIRAQGHPLRVLKTGPNSPALHDACQYPFDEYVTDLGFLPKRELQALLELSTVLIQPGESSLFNDYRLPSKLPEFLASGKPVITGKTNLGLRLVHKKEAYLIERSTPEDIARAYLELLNNKESQKTIGANGQQFAKQNFDLATNGDRLLSFYESLYSEIDTSEPREKFSHGPINAIEIAESSKANRRQGSLLRKIVNRLLTKRRPLFLSNSNAYQIDIKEPVRSTPQTKPQEINYEHYLAWEKEQQESFRQNLPVLSKSFSSGPILSLILPVYNPDIALLRKAIDSVKEQSYPNWELCIADDFSSDPEVRSLLKSLANEDSRIKIVFRKSNGHISAASNSALELADGDLIGFIDQDDMLADHALAKVALALQSSEGTEIVYSNEDKIDLDGKRSSPYFKPDWDSEFFACQNFIGHLCFIRSSLLKEVGRFDESLSGSQDWDLLLRATRLCDPRAILHLPEVLYHWRMTPASTATSADNKSYAFQAAKQALQGHIDRLGYPCEIKEHEGIYLYPFFNTSPSREVTVLFETQQASFHPQNITICDQITARLQSHTTSDSAHPGKARNENIQIAETELVCIFREGFSPLDPNWLKDLTSQINRMDVAAVAPKILDNESHVLSCGFSKIGEDSRRAEFIGIPKDADGYYHQALLPRTVDGLSSECLVFRKSAYLEVGGFSEELESLDSIDLDFCQKLANVGYRTVICPQIHIEANGKAISRIEFAGFEKH